MELRVKRAPHIDTEITVPGDKSISHRAAIIAALSNGVCRLEGFLIGDDCMRTVNALRALGVRIDEGEPNTIIVHGKKRMLTPPAAEIDCGNSATTMRLMAGLLAGQTFESRLVGDASLSKRPMDRVIAPLQRMGANITAEGPDQTPPLHIRGGSLRGIRYQMPVPSAQVKAQSYSPVFLPKEKPQLSRKRKRAITPSECCVTFSFARRGMKTAASQFLAIRFQNRATSEFPV